MKIYEVEITGTRDENFTYFFGSKAEAVKSAKAWIKEDNRLTAEYEEEQGFIKKTSPNKFSEDMVKAIDIKPNKKGILYFANIEAKHSWVNWAGGEPFSNWS